MRQGWDGHAGVRQPGLDAQAHLSALEMNAVQRNPRTALMPCALAAAAWGACGQTWCLIWAGAALLWVFAASQLVRNKRIAVPAGSRGDLWLQAVPAAIGGAASMAASGSGNFVTTVLAMGSISLLPSPVSARSASIRAVCGALPAISGCLLAGHPAHLALALLCACQAVASYTAGQDVITLLDSRENASEPQGLLQAEPSLPPAVVEFQRLLGRDQLNGLPNRHSFMYILAQETERAVRSESRLSVLLIAWDGFETAQQTARPSKLDASVSELARRLRQNLRRQQDSLASLGGGRFAAILPSTDALGAATVAGNVQTALASPELNDDGTPSESMEVSIGSATYCGKGLLTEAQLMAFAEEALRSAKMKGGNRITRYDPSVAALRPANTRHVEKAPVLTEGG